MIIEIQYKSTFIKIIIENELSIKVETLKNSLKLSLQKELEKLENKVIIDNQTSVNKSKSIQNKNISNNSTIKPIYEAHKFQIKAPYKEEIQELLLNSKFIWRLFEINPKTQVSLEKKDEDYIKVKDSCKKEKEVIKLNLYRAFKGKQSIKTSISSKVNTNKDVSEIIRKMTGAKEKLKLEEKDKKNKTNLLYDDPNIILQTLMGMDSNSGDTRAAFIRDLLSGRVGQVQSPFSNSNSNNNSNITVENNPRSNLQIRFLESMLNTGNRPIIPRPAITVIPDTVKLQQLLEMGFAEDRAKRALIMTRNNLEAAVEVISNDQDLSYQLPNESQSNQSNQSLNNHNDYDNDDIDNDYNNEFDIDEFSDNDN